MGGSHRINSLIICFFSDLISLSYNFLTGVKFPFPSLSYVLHRLPWPFSHWPCMGGTITGRSFNTDHTLTKVQYWEKNQTALAATKRIIPTDNTVFLKYSFNYGLSSNFTQSINSQCQKPFKPKQINSYIKPGLIIFAELIFKNYSQDHLYNKR